MNLQEAIRLLAQTGQEVYCKICTVDAIDAKLRTIDCTPLDESAPILGVNLQANQESQTGVVIFPAVGSFVVVAFLNQATGIAILFDEITKMISTIGDTEIVIEDKHITGKNGKVTIEIQETEAHIDVDGTTLDFDGENIIFNDGSETTANATELQKQLIKMSGRIDAIINAINAAVPGVADGGAAFKAALVAALTPHLADKEVFSNMINDKIKHG